MDPGKDLDEKKSVKAHRITDPFISQLSDLRSDGYSLFKTPATDIKDSFYVELEAKLKRFQVLIDEELRDQKSTKDKAVLETLYEQVANSILPGVSTWSKYVKAKAKGEIKAYEPKAMEDLYRISNKVSKLLRDLPEKV